MPLTLYKRGKIWHYRGTVAGQRLRGSTKTAKKAVAEQFISRIESTAWQGDFHGPGAVLTFAQAAIEYRKAGKPIRYLDTVEDYWRDTPVKRITAGAVRKAALDLYPQHSGATRNRSVIVPTQAIINHAAELDLCSKLSVRKFPVDTKEKVPATWGWIESFMANANPHLGALACFMFLTGARISEALAVTWDDVDLANRKARIRQTKIGDERRAHLPRPLLAAIANIEGERVGKVFKYSSRDTAKPQWRKACQRAGIMPLTYHCCRHGFATAMLQAGVDPVTVAKRGGWKSAQHVFQTYGHALEDETVTDRIAGTPATQENLNILKEKA